MSTRSDQQLYIVDADYRCRPELVGHSGCSYASPPQPAVQALALVRILLSCPQERLKTDDAPWHRGAPGGTLTVRLHPASADGQLHL
jgi:hypothetical protein